MHSSATESSDESVSPNPDSQQNLKQRRSNSLTPAPDNIIPTQDNWYSQENLSEPIAKPRSYSLSSEKSLLAGLTNLQSSRSETRLQDLKLMNNLPAMKSIISWLKSLRLHKYSWVFNNLTYSQMVNLTEETLQRIGITKGARHKILLSVNKLKERGSMLTELETEVMNGGDLNIALKKLKSVLQSPLQISGGEDLPSQFIKVMGKGRFIIIKFKIFFVSKIFFSIFIQRICNCWRGCFICLAIINRYSGLMVRSLEIPEFP